MAAKTKKEDFVIRDDELQVLVKHHLLGACTDFVPAQDYHVERVFESLQLKKSRKKDEATHTY